ncbi:MAG: hypothetical protein U0869_19400 [Chloroflexota bacterium]
MSTRTASRLLLALTWIVVVAGVFLWAAVPLVWGGRTLQPTALQGFWIAALVAGAATWWVVTRDPDDLRARLVAACALATVAPLAMLPIAVPGFSRGLRVGLAVATLAAVPLAFELLRRLSPYPRLPLLRLAAALAAVIALVVPWMSRILDHQAPVTRYVILAGLLLGCAGAAVAGITRVRAGSMPASRIVDSLAVVAAAVLPLVTNVALLPVLDWSASVATILVAGLVAAVLVRVAIRPLAAVAATADTHRDEVIAASEAERTRLAQALHDGPMGDITLLVQRLDASGDPDNAAIARAIATDLRSIGNDLQLPILDDLGAGPALEWLVARVARRSGAEVRLQLDAAGRPPREVELAVYRIAQEAVVNAVKHGGGPVEVRYRADATTAILTVDDGGPGWPDGVAEAARAGGRLGLVTMAQRAEAVGARLELGLSETGGAHVGMRWAATAP